MCLLLMEADLSLSAESPGWVHGWGHRHVWRMGHRGLGAWGSRDMEWGQALEGGG